MKPGITGWAQVRCGYAGTKEGSAWKLCHDLYYLKHRSLLADVMIICETLRTMGHQSQFEVEPPERAVHPGPAGPAVSAPAAAFASDTAALAEAPEVAAAKPAALVGPRRG